MDFEESVAVRKNWRRQSNKHGYLIHVLILVEFYMYLDVFKYDIFRGISLK